MIAVLSKLIQQDYNQYIYQYQFCVCIAIENILKSKGLPLRNADVEYRSEFRTTLTLFC